MRLNSVSIENFRSVKAASLKDIGDFNVLIGKNNSGKSGILAAVYSFFQILSDGSPIRAAPPIGRLSDLTNKKTDAPISISATFLLSPSDLSV